jgi:hypothetical protein
MSKTRDFNLLAKLSALYTAMTSSACDPVAVPSGLEPVDKISAFSRIFYDCADDEDGALELMRERFRQAGSDIRIHYGLHAQARDRFYDADEAINRYDRSGVVLAARSLIDVVREYAGLVSQHVARLGDSAFMYYPTCVPGHYFVVSGYRKIVEKSFNPEQSLDRISEELSLLGDLVRGFEAKRGKILAVRLSEGEDSGEGISDTSLRGRLELTEELLKRAGFVV